MQKFITYEGLPLSSGGAHQINKHSVTEVYGMLQSFAVKLTDQHQPQSVNLEFNGFILGEEIPFKLLWETIKAFGLPSWSLSQYLSTRTSVWRWIITSRQIDKALAFHERFPKLTFAAIWRFKFIDPITNRVLPGQDNLPTVDERQLNSNMYLRGGLKTMVSVWFTLPFEELDSNSAGYIRLMQSHLPFTFSGKHWRLSRVNDGKTSSQKLDIKSAI